MYTSCAFPSCSPGASIAADEHEQPSLALDFDGKRDRWNGYDPSDHSQILEEHRKIEEAKRQLKANKLKAGASGEEVSGAADRVVKWWSEFGRDWLVEALAQSSSQHFQDRDAF